MFCGRLYVQALIGVVFLILPSGSAAACEAPVDPNPITLSTGFNWPHAGSNNTGIFPVMMKEAFCRIGREVNVVRVPTARSIRQASVGLFFGEGPRRWSVVSQFTDLQLLQPPLYQLKFMAFSIEPFPDVKTYNDLAGYRAATVIGRKSVEGSLAAVLEDFTTASNETLAFQMLKVGRVDFIVIDELTGLYFAKAVGIDNLHSVVLEEHPFHLLVHVNNRVLLPTLGNALQGMHADGTVAKIIRDVVGWPR